MRASKGNRNINQQHTGITLHTTYNISTDRHNYEPKKKIKKQLYFEKHAENHTQKSKA